MRMLGLNGVGGPNLGHNLCAFCTAGVTHFALGLHTVHILYWGYTLCTLCTGVTHGPLCTWNTHCVIHTGVTTHCGTLQTTRTGIAAALPR